MEIQYLEFQNSYESLQKEVADFAKERNWLDKYDEQTLCMSLFCELGELAEVLQWESANKDIKQLNGEELNALACELADIAIYSIHFLRHIGATDRNQFILVETNQYKAVAGSTSSPLNRHAH